MRVGGPQVGEVTPLGGIKKTTLLYMQSFSRLLNGC